LIDRLETQRIEEIWVHVAQLLSELSGQRLMRPAVRHERKVIAHHIDRDRHGYKREADPEKPAVVQALPVRLFVMMRVLASLAFVSAAAEVRVVHSVPFSLPRLHADFATAHGISIAPVYSPWRAARLHFAR